jgi:hypothetical protein
MQIDEGMNLTMCVFIAPIAGIYAFTGMWIDVSSLDKSHSDEYTCLKLINDLKYFI